MLEDNSSTTWLDQLTLRQKIVLALLPGIFAFISLAAWHGYQSRQATVYYDEMVLHKTLLLAISDIDQYILQTTVEEDNRNRAQITELLSQLDTLRSSPDLNGEIHARLSALSTYITETVVKAPESINHSVLEKTQAEIKSLEKQLQQHINTLQAAHHAMQQQFNTVSLVIIVTGIILLLSCFSLAPRLILKPIDLVHQLARKITAGKTHDTNVLLPDNALNQILALFRTLTNELQRTREKLSDMSNLDPLTHTLTAKIFSEHLNEEAARANRYQGSAFSLLLIELDHFNTIKDTFGEKAIDDILCFIAKLLIDQVRTTDSVSRFKLAEFAVLLPETQTQGATILADRICENITTQSQSLGTHVTVSIGIATYHAHASSANELLARGYDALSRAIRNGRNQIVVAKQLAQSQAVTADRT